MFSCKFKDSLLLHRGFYEGAPKLTADFVQAWNREGVRGLLTTLIFFHEMASKQGLDSSNVAAGDAEHHTPPTLEAYFSNMCSCLSWPLKCQKHKQAKQKKYIQSCPRKGYEPNPDHREVP